jgi:hypothetical protein
LTSEGAEIKTEEMVVKRKSEVLANLWQGKQLYFFKGRVQFGINLY